MGDVETFRLVQEAAAAVRQVHHLAEIAASARDWKDEDARQASSPVLIAGWARIADAVPVVLGLLEVQAERIRHELRRERQKKGDGT